MSGCSRRPAASSSIHGIRWRERSTGGARKPSWSARGRRKARCPGRLAPDLIQWRLLEGGLGLEGLPSRYSRGLTRVILASLVMASSFPCCEIRQLLVHIYPGGSKAGAAERITVFYGRRGRPVKKPRFIPAELAHQWARKLQARRLGTVSVL